MKRTVNLRVAVVTAVFMMVSGIASVNAQFLYKDSHLFIGQAPAYTSVE
jgi:hypothetical protein